MLPYVNSPCNEKPKTYKDDSYVHEQLPNPNLDSLLQKIELEIDSRGRRGVAEGPECVEAETEGCRGAAETGATGIAAVMAIFLKIPHPNFRAETNARGDHTALAPHPSLVAAAMASTRQQLHTIAGSSSTKITLCGHTNVQNFSILYPLDAPGYWAWYPGLDNRLELLLFHIRSEHGQNLRNMDDNADAKL